jgi:argininosuccinate lyase
VAEERDFESLRKDEWQAASELFGNDIAARVTARASVGAKRTPQSTAPRAVGEALAELTQWFTACNSASR